MTRVLHPPAAARTLVALLAGTVVAASPSLAQTASAGFAVPPNALRIGGGVQFPRGRNVTPDTLRRCARPVCAARSTSRR